MKVGGADSAFSARGETAPLTSDSAVLVNAWEHHAYTHPVAPGERTLILALYNEPNWLADIQRSLAMSGHPRFFLQNCVRVTAATRKITEEFVLELWWAAEISPSRPEQLLFNLIISVVEGYSGWRDLISLLRSKPPVATDPRIRQAIALMRQDVGRDLDMDTLAAQTGLSRAHFFALFQRDTQVTPLVYANVLRFEAAVQRLTQSQESVGDVAYGLGFAAPGHFSRFFRQHLGLSAPRLEDAALLTGRGRFGDDLGAPPGTLHAAVLRSPHAHARLLAVDTAAALALPGVHAVLTGQDVQRWQQPFVVGVKVPMQHCVLAVDKVRYAGEPVAVVVAQDRYTAEDALDLLRPEYEALPAVVDIQAACAKAAGLTERQLDGRYSDYARRRRPTPHAAQQAVDRQRLA